MSQFKGKVRENALKWIRERKGTSQWLEENLSFEHGQRLSEEDRHKVVELFDWMYQGVRLYKRRQKVLDLEILVANLLAARHKPVAISLDESHWKPGQHQRASPSIIELVKILRETGYIGMKKGYHFENNSRQTRIWATDKLLSYLPVYPQQVIYEPVNLVELRDEKGNLKDYQDTQKTRRIKAILEKANRVNAQADIRYGKYKLSASLIAIFNRKFTLYGRLHTRGYRHYQGLSEEQRAEITINGEPVVELDFSGLHPRLLYAQEGIQFDQDPYTIIDPNANKDNETLRKFYKDSLLSLLNAQEVVVNKDNPNRRNWTMSPEQAARAGIDRRIGFKNEYKDELAKSNITKGKEVIEAFKRAHRPIAHYFCSGKETGLRVMNLDARIALDVVNHFAKQNIPVLAVHDSFIVQDQYRDELYRTMDAFYQKHTGGFTCPID